MAANTHRIIPIFGNDLVDIFHRHLGTLLLEARARARDGDGLGVLAKVGEFRDTADGHFTIEEVILRGIGYDGIDEHSLAHASYIAKLEEGLARLRGRDVPAERYALIELVESVLFDHELLEDSTFFSELKCFDDTPFIWQDAWDVGDPVIDEQHRQLLGNLDDFRKNQACDANSPMGRDLLNAFVNQTHLHLVQEEEILAQRGIVDVEHRREHARLARSLERRLADFESGVGGKLIADFLCYWLIDHIVNSDIPDFKQS